MESLYVWAAGHVEDIGWASHSDRPSRSYLPGLIAVKPETKTDEPEGLACHG